MFPFVLPARRVLLPHAADLNLRKGVGLRLYSLLRAAFDIVAALVVLVVAAPLLLGIAVAIWWEDRGPILFQQIRVGQHGRPFTLYKFRSLRSGQHNPQDPRSHTTAVGALLRTYGLDELPQLWNVLRGEMSLIGPRPILPSEAQHYDAWDAQRLAVRPGLTGWAQVNGRNALAWYERIAHDVWYVQHQGFWLDLRILCRTPRVLFTGQGAYGAGNHDPSGADFIAYRTQRPRSLAPDPHGRPTRAARKPQRTNPQRPHSLSNTDRPMTFRYATLMLVLIGLGFLAPSAVAQGTVDGQFTTNVNGTTLTFTVQLKASPGTAGVGTSTLQITYNNTDLTFQSGTYANYTGTQAGQTPSGHNAIYSSTFSQPNANEVSLNIELTSCVTNSFTACSEGETLPSTFKDVATLTFTINDINGTASLDWDTLEVFDGGGQQYTNGTFTANNDGFLPVELSSFDVVRTNEAVLLSWSTASETNNAGFSVEHQPPQKATWSEVAFVQGAGTTLEAQTYRHRLQAATPGVHRFRLRQVDYDGAFEYSPEVEVLVELTDAYRLSPVYPNPVHYKAMLTLTTQAAQQVVVKLYDVLGREVARLYQGTVAAHQPLHLAVEGGSWKSGVYFVHVEGETFHASQRLTVAR